MGSLLNSYANIILARQYPQDIHQARLAQTLGELVFVLQHLCLEIEDDLFRYILGLIAHPFQPANDRQQPKRLGGILRSESVV